MWLQNFDGEMFIALDHIEIQKSWIWFSSETHFSEEQGTTKCALCMWNDIYGYNRIFSSSSRRQGKYECKTEHLFKEEGRSSIFYSLSWIRIKR